MAARVRPAEDAAPLATTWVCLACFCLA